MQQQEPQAKLFFFATTKIRIGRGTLYSKARYRQAKPFSFVATKLESDAEVVVAEPQLSCSDSQIDPLKSRITAAAGSFPDKTLQ